jgi:putative flippase GtrA
MKKQLAWYFFGAVIALIADYCIVWIGLRVGLLPWIARVPGLLVGVTITYFMSRRFAFSAATAASVAEWSRYVSQQAVGTLINLSVSLVGLHLGDRSTLQIALAMMVGAGVGFVYNFFAARRVLHQPTNNSSTEKR